MINTLSFCRRQIISATAVAIVSVVAAQTAGAEQGVRTKAVPPSCSSFSSPFPCGTGTYQVCTKMVTCIPGSGTVEKSIQQCAQAKCVKETKSSQGFCQTGNKAADAKCAKDHNMKRAVPTGSY